MIGHLIPFLSDDSLLGNRNLHDSVIRIRSNVRGHHIVLVDIHQLEDIWNYLIKGPRAELSLKTTSKNTVIDERSGDPFLCDQHIVHIRLYIGIPYVRNSLVVVVSHRQVHTFRRFVDIAWSILLPVRHRRQNRLDPHHGM